MRNPLEISKRYAEMVRIVVQKCGADAGARCGYDLLMGLHKDNVNQRYLAWTRHVDEEARKMPHTDTQRDGVWVPAIEET